jgi:hypothetical protein
MRKNILAGRTGPDIFPAPPWSFPFFHAEDKRQASYYLAAAVYA